MTDRSRQVVGLAFSGIATLGFGVGTVLAVAGSQPGWALVFLGLFAFYLCIAVALVLRLRPSVSEPSLCELDGEAATFIPRWAAPSVLALVGTGALGACAVVGAVALVLEHKTFAAVVIGLVAGWFLWFPAFAVLGRWRIGGLWVTPTRIVEEVFGTRSVVRWGDVASVHLDNGRVSLAASRVDVQRRIPGPTRPTDRLDVNPHDLVMSPPALLRVLSPSDDWGTPGSLARVEEAVAEEERAGRAPYAPLPWMDTEKASRQQLLVAVLVALGVVVLRVVVKAAG